MRVKIKGSYRQVNEDKERPESTKAVWRIQVYTGKKPHPKDPSRQIYGRVVETFRGTESQASKRAERLSREVSNRIEKGIPIPSGKLTVADLLTQWLDGYVRINCGPRTVESYESTVSRHLVPGLGHILLKQINHQAIEEYYRRAQEKKLSAKSVLYHHRLLKQALKYGVKHEYLGRNPADLVTPPRPQRRDMRHLTQSEVQDLLIAAASNSHYPIIYMAVSTGMRQAELLGLRWRDIDLDLEEPSISVSRTLYKRRGVCSFIEPKSQHSRRRIGMTPKLAELVSEHRLERQRLYYELRRDLTLDDLVFANEEGQPIDPGVLSHNFARIARRAGLKQVRFHDLRHTWATLALLKGIHPKVVSETLGHASVAFTLDTYSDKIPSMQKQAMVVMDEVFPVGVNGGVVRINTNLTHNEDITLGQP